jgi:hypothetical protein
MNRETNGTGARTTISDLPFELEVVGDNIENDDDFSKADSDYSYGVDQVLSPTSFRTSGQHGKIIWRKTSASPSDGHYPNGLEPNSRGRLTFWVVAKNDGELCIDFDFKLRGFIGTYTEAEDEDEEDELDNLFEINDDLEVTAENGLIDADDLALKKEALEYAKGHILFFADYDTTNNYYSGFLGTARSITFSDCINKLADPIAKYSNTPGVSVEQGMSYPVTIYWKWANTLEQMVLDENSPKKDSPLFKSTNTTDRNAMFAYLKATSDNKVFDSVSASTVSTDIDSIKNETSSMDAALTELTNAYNNADSIIGNNIDYLMIEMSARVN